MKTLLTSSVALRVAATSFPGGSPGVTPVSRQKQSSALPLAALASTALSRVAGGHVELVPQRLIADSADLAIAFRKVVTNGGEGLMLRRPGHFYEFGRSGSWLKMKPAGVD